MFETYPNATSPRCSRGARSHAVSQARWPNIAEPIHTAMQLLSCGLNGYIYKGNTVSHVYQVCKNSIKLGPSYLHRERCQTLTSSGDRKAITSVVRFAVTTRDFQLSIRSSHTHHTALFNYVIFCHDLMSFVNKWKHNHGQPKLPRYLQCAYPMIMDFGM